MILTTCAASGWAVKSAMFFLRIQKYLSKNENSSLIILCSLRAKVNAPIRGQKLENSLQIPRKCCNIHRKSGAGSPWGIIAQLGVRPLHVRKVTGSSPVGPINEGTCTRNFIRDHSSAGMSVRLTCERSQVRTLLVPLIQARERLSSFWGEL